MRHLMFLPFALAFVACCRPSKHVQAPASQPAPVVISDCTLPPLPVWAHVVTDETCPERYVLCLDPANGRVLERNLQAQRRWIEDVRLRCSDNAPDAKAQSSSTGLESASSSATATHADAATPSVADVLDGGPNE